MGRPARRAGVDDAGGHRPQARDPAGHLFQMAHRAGQDLEHEAVLAGHVVRLDDLRAWCRAGRGTAGSCRSGSATGRRPSRSGRPAPGRRGAVAGDHAGLFEAAHPFGDGTGGHRDGAGQLRVRRPPVPLQLGRGGANRSVEREVPGHPGNVPVDSPAERPRPLSRYSDRTVGSPSVDNHDEPAARRRLLRRPARSSRPTSPTCGPRCRAPNRGCVLIDSRSGRAWDQGHIPGAVHLPTAEIAEPGGRTARPGGAGGDLLLGSGLQRRDPGRAGARPGRLPGPGDDRRHRVLDPRGLSPPYARRGGDRRAGPAHRAREVRRSRRHGPDRRGARPAAADAGARWTTIGTRLVE